MTDTAMIADVAAQPLHAPPSIVRRLRRAMTSSPALMGLILLLLLAFFTAMRPDTFASVFNIRNIFLDASGLLILATGMTFVMIAGGFDLSIGSVLVFSGVAAAKTMETLGGEGVGVLIAGTIAAMLSGIAWGVFNGVCIARLRVSALITTLGSMGAALGLAYLLTDGNDVRTVPKLLMSIGRDGRIAGTFGSNDEPTGRKLRAAVDKAMALVG